MDSSAIVYKDNVAFVRDEVLYSAELNDLNLENDFNTTENTESEKTMEPGLKRIIFSCIFMAVTILVSLLLSNLLLPNTDEKHGGVASTFQSCSTIGSDLMKSDGTAVDAAIATSLCLAITDQYKAGFLGGGTVIYRQQRNNISFVYDFLGNNKPDYTSESNISYPGLLKGLEKMHKQHGALDWEDIVFPVLTYAKLLKINLTSVADQITMQTNIDILTNISTGGVQAFYSSNLIESMIVSRVSNHQSFNGEYKVVANPISYRFKDYLIEMGPPPSSAVVMILFLNVIQSLNDAYGINSSSLNYNDTILKTSTLSDAHIGLFYTNKTLDVVALLQNKDYARHLATCIHGNLPIDFIPKFDSESFFGILSSNAVIVGPDDELISIALTLGLRANETTERLNGLNLNLNNRPITNVGPIILSNPDKPCLFRSTLNYKGTYSSPSVLGRLILELINEKQNLTNAILKTKYLPHQDDIPLISLAKFKENIIKDNNRLSITF